MKKIRVLAVDPGYERMGVAILEKKEKEDLIFSECFKTKKEQDFSTRLKEIGVELNKIIKEYNPGFLAIEKLYFSTNHKTAMAVAEARGVILYCASLYNLKIIEFTPPEIKLAVTGYGKADKKMIMDMVPKLIKIDKKTNSDDELDAIAIGLTFFANYKNI